MSALEWLARRLRTTTEAAEESMHSERAARHVLTRRSFFGAVAAMSGAKVFGLPAPGPLVGQVTWYVWLWYPSESARALLQQERMAQPYIRLEYAVLKWGIASDRE